MTFEQAQAFLSQPAVFGVLLAIACGGLLLLKRPWAAVYVALIPLINWSFAHVPTVAMFDGGVFQPLAVVTGLVLVVRDFAQKELGARIFLAMAAGLFFSALTTPAAIVIASGAAFLVSETVDWAVYTFSKKPLSQRVWLSSLFGAPVDTAIFLFGANMVTPGVFAWSTIVTSIVSKLAGAWVVSLILARRERGAAAPATA